MKPPVFHYVAPGSLDEAIQQLGEYGDSAKLLAGGQSLVPLLNMRLAGPDVLIDVNGVGGLDHIEAWDGGLTIGALARQSALERSHLAGDRLPLLAEAIHFVGHPTIRHRGTVGGSLAHADPAAELPAVMLALEASLVARGPRGERTIPAAEFFQGYLTTALAADEMLTEVLIPGVPPGTGSAFLELARRFGDFAICGAAATITLDENGRCSRARVALCGVGPTPLRATETEALLEGALPDAPTLAAAAERAALSVDPQTDIHGTAAYRRKMAIVMTGRAVELAASRAQGGARP